MDLDGCCNLLILYVDLVIVLITVQYIGFGLIEGFKEKQVGWKKEMQDKMFVCKHQKVVKTQ